MVFLSGYGGFIGVGYRAGEAWGELETAHAWASPRPKPPWLRSMQTLAECGMPKPHLSNFREELNSHLNLYYGCPEDIRAGEGGEGPQNNTAQQLYKFSHSSSSPGPTSVGSRLWPLPRVCANAAGLTCLCLTSSTLVACVIYPFPRPGVSPTCPGAF